MLEQSKLEGSILEEKNKQDMEERMSLRRSLRSEK